MPWWTEDAWGRMVSGDQCGMCADASNPVNPHSVLVTELPTTCVRLVRNQTQAGYCVVILNRHVSEMHHLDPSALSAFWAEVGITSRAISDLLLAGEVGSPVDGPSMPALALPHLSPVWEQRPVPEHRHQRR